MWIVNRSEPVEIEAVCNVAVIGSVTKASYPKIRLAFGLPVTVQQYLFGDFFFVANAAPAKDRMLTSGLVTDVVFVWAVR